MVTIGYRWPTSARLCSWLLSSGNEWLTRQNRWGSVRESVKMQHVDFFSETSTNRLALNARVVFIGCVKEPICHLFEY